MDDEPSKFLDISEESQPFTFDHSFADSLPKDHPPKPFTFDTFADSLPEIMPPSLLREPCESSNKCTNISTPYNKTSNGYKMFSIGGQSKGTLKKKDNRNKKKNRIKSNSIQNINANSYMNYRNEIVKKGTLLIDDKSYQFKLVNAIYNNFNDKLIWLYQQKSESESNIHDMKGRIMLLTNWNPVMFDKIINQAIKYEAVGVLVITVLTSSVNVYNNILYSIPVIIINSFKDGVFIDFSNDKLISSCSFSNGLEYLFNMSTADGKCKQMIFYGQTTIIDVKRMVEECWGIKVSMQIIYSHINEIPLKDNEFMCDIALQSNPEKKSTEAKPILDPSIPIELVLIVNTEKCSIGIQTILSTKTSLKFDDVGDGTFIFRDNIPDIETARKQYDSIVDYEAKILKNGDQILHLDGTDRNVTKTLENFMKIHEHMKNCTFKRDIFSPDKQILYRNGVPTPEDLKCVGS